MANVETTAHTRDLLRSSRLDGWHQTSWLTITQVDMSKFDLCALVVPQQQQPQQQQQVRKNNINDFCMLAR